MRNSLRLRSSLVALCLVPLCLASCSKENKKDSDEGKSTTEDTTAAPGKAVESAPVADKKMPATPGEGALAYLPKECAISFHVDIQAGMKNAGVAATILPKVKAAFEDAKKSKGDLAAFVKSTGVDVFGDFHELGVCFSSIPKNGDDLNGMGVVTGSAKPGLLTALVATSKDSKKFTTVEVGGAKGVLRDSVYVLQLDDGTLIFGNDKAQLEASMSKPNGQGNHFAEVGKATLRVVVPTATTKTGFGMPGSPFASFADKIEGASSLTADLDSRSVILRIGTASNETATELAGIAKLLLGQVPQVPGKGMEVEAMAALAAATVKGEGKAMVGTVTFQASTLQMGMEKIANDM